MIKYLLYIPSLVVLAFYFLPPKTISVLPGNGIHYRLSTYVSSIDTTRGSMGKLTTVNDSLIVYEYMLDTVNHNESLSPISGFSIKFDLDAQNNYLNVKKMRYLNIKIRMINEFAFTMHLKTREFFTDTTDTTKWYTQRYLYTDEKVDPRGSSLSLEFRSFREPYWWPDKIDKTLYLKMDSVPDFRQVMGLDFQSPMGTRKLHVPVRMEMSEISFSEDPGARKKVCLSFFFVLVCAATLVAVLLSLKKSGGRKEPHPQEGTAEESESQAPHIELKRFDEEQTEKLDEYLKNNYQNPDLSIELVYRDTAISTERISYLLRKKYGKLFREYLNHLRITEAKYQLQETDRNIAEIAYKVGYNSIPHFNRVFRQTIGQSPKEFREQQAEPGKKSD